MNLKLIFTFILFSIGQLSMAATLSGTIKDGTEPLSGALVTVFLAGDSVSHSTTSTDTNGYYSIELPNNTYRIEISKEGYTTSHVNEIVINTNDVTQNVVLISNKTITISGKLTDSTGQPLPNFNIYSVHENGTRSQDGTTDQDGNYSISDVPPNITGYFNLGYLGYSDGSSRLSVSRLSVIENINSDTIINIQLSKKIIKISGKITDANGVAIPRAYVIISNVDNNNYRAYKDFYTQDDGSYTFLGWSDIPSRYTISPPSNSGFFRTESTIPGVTSDTLQNFIFTLPDSTAPKIIGKVLISSITDTTATIQWQTDEPSTSIVKFGTGGSISNTINSTELTRDHEVLIQNLSPNTDYNVQVSVTDASGNGPTLSDLIPFKTISTPDKTPPIITEGPFISSITHNSLTVSWKTDEPATSEVVDFISKSEFVTEHNVVLTGLSPSTSYDLQIKTLDTFGNGPTMGLTNAKTLATPDTFAPVIVSGPLVLDITDTEATIVWETDEPAISGVSYNDGTAHSVVKDNNLENKHKVRLTGLTPSTTYFYTVSSTDALANGPTLSKQKSFTTMNAPDNYGPILTSQIKIVGVTHKSAVIQWKTDEPSSATIHFGKDITTLDRSLADSKLNNKHNIQLTNLSENTTYYFKIVSSDAKENTSESDVVSFNTRNLPETSNATENQTVGPIFKKEPVLLKALKDKLIIEWETNEPTDYQIFYGIGSDRSLQKAEGKKKKKHEVILTNLKQNQTYGFKIIVKDSLGNTSIFESE